MRIRIRTISSPDASLTVPVVSVITPTYGVGGVSRQHQLRRAYESLHAQQFRNSEWLAVGDGCADETGRLVRTWAMTDWRVSWSIFGNKPCRLL
jgi:glycosyltransferase involved in cell wall biosynthesis